MKNDRETKLHEALTQRNAALFKHIPHTDLHCHAMGSAPFDTLKTLYPQIERPPERFGSFQNFNDYLRRNIVPAITNINDVREVTQAAFNRLINEGVAYTEMSFDLTIPEHLGVTLEEYLETIRDEAEKVRSSLKVCLEAGLDRETNPDKLLILFRQAVARVVFGSIDLYGVESARPIEKYKKIYEIARDHGLKRKAHVGEFGSADDVRKAIETLDLQVIQHGVQAVRDPNAIRLITRRNITLNIAPQSNLALGVINDIRNHPIQRLLRDGVSVTVNTDDYTVFNRSVAEQLIGLYDSGVCSENEIAQIINNGLQQIPHE